MKFLSENQSNNGSSSSNINNSSNLANWLGFSLSPHMKMESTSPPNTSTDISQQHNQYHHHYHNHHQAEQLQQQQQQQQSNMSMFLAAHQQQQLNSGAVCYDVGGGENSGAFLHTPLTVMPLKSDGSLCIMEALTRSQQPEVHAAPKLEDFLGSSQERGTMALSLDSLYYQHTAEQEAHRQQQQQFESYFSAMACQGFSYEGLFKNWINTNADNMNDGLVDNGGSSSVTLAAPPVTCGDLQSLTLSMSPGSQSSCVTAGTDSCVVNAMETNKKRGFGKVGHKHTVHRKSIESFGQRTSQYRGVTKHRWTGRYEAHLWDNSCKKEGQTRKGRQVYLGGYDMEEKAARSYDLAALKYWGLQTHTNFPIESYNDEIEHMKNMTRQEYVAHLRRKSSGFSRGASMYRGVTRHHQHGRWQARIGRVAGNKDLYLGTFSTQEEAAEAYDVAAIRFRGISAVTNFDISRYDVEKIMDSNTLLAGEQAKRSKVEPLETIEASPSVENAGDATVANDGNSPVDWKMVLYNSHGEQQTSSCMNGGYGNPSFSLALQDLVGLETGSPTSQAMGEDSNKLGAAHFSNASSLVTSLNSSREGSPDKNGTSSSPMASRFVNPVSIVNPWMISSQLRPAAAAIPVAHLPVFAAWGDT